MNVPRDLLLSLLRRLGTKTMTHNGHIGPTCPLSLNDWIAEDECNCGRDDDIKAVAGLLSGRLP